MKENPAFPVVLANTIASTGMSLRDCFAAKAMQAFALQALKDFERPQQQTCAQAAYLFADAMLAEREKK